MSAENFGHFQAFGFAVLRGFFDANALADEVDQALLQGLVRAPEVWHGEGARFQYVPMMTARTPLSLALLDRAETLATSLLGGPVLPTRAKGVRYRGDTPWHTDSVLSLASVGFAAYLEPVRAKTGALRVIPGSHRAEFGDALRLLDLAGMRAADAPAHIIETDPGDVIVFDEHLFHSSCGGSVRRQWRLDFIADPADLRAEELAQSYFAGIFPRDWDGGYDAERYPSYGPDWRGSGRSSVERLGALGVYELAAKQEARSR